MTVPVTKKDENGYLGGYKEIKYLDVHFRVKCYFLESQHFQGHTCKSHK